jgi:hypothetical protein
MGTSLHVLGPGEDVSPTPSGPGNVEAPMNEARDRGALLARFARLGGRALELVVGIDEPSLALVAGIGESDDRPSPNPEPRSEAQPSAPRSEAQPSERVRIFILAFAGLALWTYARCRRLLRRDRPREEGRSGARPGMPPHRHLQGAGMGRVEA